MTTSATSEKRHLYYLAHRTQIREQNRRAYRKNRLKILTQQKAFRDDRPGLVSARVAAWRKANPEKFKALRRREKARIRATRPWEVACRSLISCAVRSMGYTKKSRTTSILGCDWITFKTWIERMFVPGMSWKNYGEWHLDHIVPVATAKNEEECLQLNHYTNLQPLWESDNLSKKDSTEHLVCRLPG